MKGGASTISELYLASCSREEQELTCDVCKKRTKHECQSRMLTVPNVLVVRIKRDRGARIPVAVEEQFELSGMLSMSLIGVVYHRGASTDSGHYTCLCRGPRGRFWYYDDNKPVEREESEVAQVRPRDVYMLVYGRRDGSAEWLDCSATGDHGSAETSVGSPVRRRVREKTSAEAAGFSPGSARDAAAQGSVRSPPSKRMNRNLKQDEASASVNVPAPSCAAPEYASAHRSVGSPVRRRLSGKRSREAAGLSPGNACDDALFKRMNWEN